MTRVYVAATLADLETLSDDGRLLARSGYAATARLAAEFPDADDDELAYAAMAAARQDAPPPRIVLAADVDAVEDPGDAGVMTLSEPVRLVDVASFHVESADDPDSDLAWYATQELGDLIAMIRTDA